MTGAHDDLGLAKLYIGSDRNVLEGRPQFIATLYRFLLGAGKFVPIVVVSEFRDDESVTTRLAIYDPREEGFDFLGMNEDQSDYDLDAELFEALGECATQLGGWITFETRDGEDHIPETLEQREAIKARAIDVERHRWNAAGGDDTWE